jgi:hypothetical protein
MNAPEPIIFTSIKTEAELRFSLTNKKFRAMQAAAKEGTQSDLDLGFLWDTCDNTEGIPRDEFIEHFPIADPEVLGGLVKAIMDEWVSKSKHPKNEKYRPTKAATQESKPSTGSGLLDFGGPTLAA